MKFNVVNLGYKSTPDYPYSHRIEMVTYTLAELDNMYDWIIDNKIPATSIGYRGNVIYLQEKDITLFLLKWA